MLCYEVCIFFADHMLQVLVKIMVPYAFLRCESKAIVFGLLTTLLPFSHRLHTYIQKLF